MNRGSGVMILVIIAMGIIIPDGLERQKINIQRSS
jgi:hypothetical protein